MVKAIVSLSGGLDSTTVLAACLKEHSSPGEVVAVLFRYPSKHNVHEAAAAAKVADHYGVRWRTVDLVGVFAHFKSDLLLTGGAVPEGHYEEESMRATVVPFRNGIFLAVLAGLAESLGAGEVWLGTHAGDHHIYPDCRPDFVHAMTAAVEFGTDKKVTTVAPYEVVDKAEIVRRGLALGVPYHLTRTCYKNQSVACGKCGSCQERLEAFAASAATDPLEYESRELLPKKGQ